MDYTKLLTDLSLGDNWVINGSKLEHINRYSFVDYYYTNFDNHNFITYFNLQLFKNGTRVILNPLKKKKLNKLIHEKIDWIKKHPRQLYVMVGDKGNEKMKEIGNYNQYFGYSNELYSMSKSFTDIDIYPSFADAMLENNKKVGLTNNEDNVSDNTNNVSDFEQKVKAEKARLRAILGK